MAQPLDPNVVIPALFPKRAERTVATDLLVEAIKVAHGQNPITWSVTLTTNYARLNTGKVEVFALYQGSVHLICDRLRLPQELRSAASNDTYASIPNSTSLDFDVEDTGRILPLARSAWHSAVRVGADSARSAGFRRYHSAHLIEYLSRSHDGVPVPGWQLPTG